MCKCSLISIWTITAFVFISSSTIFLDRRSPFYTQRKIKKASSLFVFYLVCTTRDNTEDDDDGNLQLLFIVKRRLCKAVLLVEHLNFSFQTRKRFFILDLSKVINGLIWCNLVQHLVKNLLVYLNATQITSIQAKLPRALVLFFFL